jgi:hypothetical protein
MKNRPAVYPDVITYHQLLGRQDSFNDPFESKRVLDIIQSKNNLPRKLVQVNGKLLILLIPRMSHVLTLWSTRIRRFRRAEPSLLCLVHQSVRTYWPTRSPSQLGLRPKLAQRLCSSCRRCRGWFTLHSRRLARLQLLHPSTKRFHHPSWGRRRPLGSIRHPEPRGQAGQRSRRFSWTRYSLELARFPHHHVFCQHRLWRGYQGSGRDQGDPVQQRRTGRCPYCGQQRHLQRR